MKKIRMKGKSVNEAVKSALEVLGGKKEEAKVNILSEGKPGMLGMIGGEEAEVQVILLGGAEEDVRRSRFYSPIVGVECPDHNIVATISIHVSSTRYWLPYFYSRYGHSFPRPGKRSSTLTSIPRTFASSISPSQRSSVWESSLRR